MAKRYTVCPVLRPGRRSYSATFRDASGRRVTRGLGTRDRALAGLVCEGLVLLHALPPGEECPEAVPELARSLYYGVGREGPGGAVFARPARPPADDVLLDAGDVAQDVRVDAAALVARAAAQAGEVADLRWRVQCLEGELAAERNAHAALKASALARAALAGRDCPPIVEALALFRANLTAETSRENVSIVYSLARRFVASLPSGIANTAQITADHIGAFLDAQCADAPDPPGRRGRLRVRLSRFVRWAAMRWSYPNQMDGVPRQKRAHLRRGKKPIAWHEQAAVEAAIAALPDDYWRALVATLAYAGLQLGELCWLRAQDLVAEASGHYLVIGAVTDPEGGEHPLKTEHRHRRVAVHARLLLPRLAAHLDVGGAGEYYLFPSRVRRRRRKVTGGMAERWLPRTLSGRLLGDPGGATRRPRAALLPPGMGPMSLRRTFGSLLLRSGKSAEEVAAAMGNTPGVVREHYARILGGEVKVDF